MNWIPETIIRALCWTLLHSLWQGLILAVVAGIVMVLTKRAKSATRYTILSFLVLAFLAVSGYTFFREWRTPATETILTRLQPVQVQAPMVATPQVNGVTTQTGFMRQLVQYFNAHASVVVVIWFIVFLARLVSLLSGLAYAQRIRHYRTSPAGAEWQERLSVLLARLKISRPVTLLESALIKVPVVVGWLKPVILVPVGMLAQLPAGQVESILLHELAHICRRDYLFNFGQHLVDTMYFFNPALLWVSSLIRTERENCCDDVAIRETRSRRRLIEALVSFHQYQESSGYHALGFAGKDNNVVRRVERIVHRQNHSLNAGERALLMGGVMLLCGAFVAVKGHQRTDAIVRARVESRQTLTRGAGTGIEPREMGMEDARVGDKGMRTGIEPTRVKAAIRIHAAVQTRERPVSVDTTVPQGTMTMADVEKIMKARDHGVTTEFLNELKNAGYTVSLEDAIRLKDHGVTIEFLQALQKEGYGHVSLDEAVRLVDHGVSVGFIERIRALGFPNLTLEDAVKLVDHGVSAEFIVKWKKKTGATLELYDYVRLQDAGVKPE